MKRILLYILSCLFLVEVSAQSTRKIRELESQRNELQQQIAESETLLRSTKKDVKSQLDNLALITGQMDQSADADILKKAALAKSLETIGEHIGALDISTSAFSEAEYSYSVLWNDLKTLAENNTIDSMGSRAYGIALYNRIIAMVVSHYADFANEGVAASEMHTLLDELELALVETKASLTNSEVNRGFDTLIDGAEQNMATARSMINGLKGGNS